MDGRDRVPPLCSRAGNEQEPTLGFASFERTRSTLESIISWFAVTTASQMDS